MSKVWDVPVKFGGKVNLVLLHHELGKALDGVVGVSTGPYGVRAHLNHEPSAKEVSAVKSTVAKHNADAKTQAQLEAEADAKLLATLKGKEWHHLTSDERNAAQALMYKKITGGQIG